jgi:hypothetical protein
MGHELAVGRVIGGLDANDLLFERMVLLGEVPQKLELCCRGSQQEHLIRVGKRGRDLLEKKHTIARVVVLGRRPLGVTVEVMLRGSDGLLLELLGIDAEDARLLVVQPHDGLMSIHWQVAKQSARQTARGECFGPGSGVALVVGLCWLAGYLQRWACSGLELNEEN